jgi:hypothetical protein
MTDPTDFDLLFDDIIRQRGGMERFSPTSLAIARKLAMTLADPDSSPNLVQTLEEMLPKRSKASDEDDFPDKLYEECRAFWIRQPGEHGPAASPAHVEACNNPACKAETLRALEIAMRACRASDLKDEQRQLAEKIRAEEVAHEKRPESLTQK